MADRELPAGPGRRARAPRRRRARLASGAPLLAAALLLVGCTAPTATSGAAPARAAKPTPTPTPQGPYVALGDSYTSGLDIPDPVGSPAGCDRSSRNYPSLVARYFKLGPSEVHDVSCSGATTGDLSSPQSTQDGSNPAQLSSVDAGTALVTVGIGGNDIDFTGILTHCVALDALGDVVGKLHHFADEDAPCRAYYTDDGTDQIGQRIGATATALAGVLARIRQLAPHSRVFVVGYPDLLPTADSAGCAHVLGVTAADVDYLNGEEVQLNRVLQQQARAAGDVYVDTYTPSRGHDACAARATRWIEPLFPDAAAAPMHPNAVGQQGIATAVEHSIAAAY
ncbi:SGNH/GDSL hydrolase family protein [Streptacidiphilus sp. P02-A3a]|uniref:SGNH/GDSL hydrolase family protein n=1 Tax=Streptacidiphilus sp. P02-A3a TaxID=2704468 RepID=UPI0015FD4393|nr:SGNH/GDSL hydrolase family protein [Streptacidiphilus sp. P02-A3a]QMU71434.1 SGNH/GDSL hydrolase family protein [Streptacidiphilus sp. P02-A3a]